MAEYSNNKLIEISKGVFKCSPNEKAFYASSNGTFLNEEQYNKLHVSDRMKYLKIENPALKKADSESEDNAAKERAKAEAEAKKAAAKAEAEAKKAAAKAEADAKAKADADLKAASKSKANKGAAEAKTKAEETKS
jgi:membrane protein involved in colicin uptake